MAKPALSESRAESREPEASKPDPKLALVLTDYLKTYQQALPAPERDTLNGRYRIELGQPLPEFNSKTAMAYAGSDLGEEGASLIALVCERGTVQRNTVIQQLLKLPAATMLSVQAAGVVELSRPAEERFVIMLSRPRGKKLSALLSEMKTPLNSQFICEHIIAPVTAAIRALGDAGLSHGRINADNIYFAESAVLGECVSEPCGVSQLFFHEPLERMQALPYGKGEGDSAHDCYALAVLVLYVLFGPQYFAGMTPESLMKAILKEGVYATLIGQQEVPDMFNDFFRGIFNHNSDARWDYHRIESWLAGKRYNVLPPPAAADAARPFEFGGTQVSTRRELAQVLQDNWEKVPATLQTTQLSHWFTISLRKKELSEQVTRIARSITGSSGRNETQLNEQLTQLLMLIDPNGPARIRQLSFHLDGIHTLYADLFARDARQELGWLLKFLELGLVGFWQEIQHNERNREVSRATSSVLLRLDNVAKHVRSSGMGFGLERVLYDLNPEMPCMSTILAGSWITTLQGLLLRLDRLAPRLAQADEPIDRHIAAFIASRLGMQHEIISIANTEHGRAMTALRLLASAQRKAGLMALPGLTHWLGLRVLPMVESLHSATLRAEIKGLLLKYVKSGSALQMAELLASEGYASADNAGFATAQQRFQMNAQKLEEYRHGKGLGEYSDKVGYAIAKSVACLGFLASLIRIMGNMH